MSGARPAIGGTWDDTAKTFNVAAPTVLAAGAGDAIDAGERMLFTDPGSGKQVGVSFGGVPAGMTFSADLMDPADVASLRLVSGDGTVLAAWDFTTDLPADNEVLLSFDVGLGWEDVKVWHFDGGAWSPFSPDLFTYDSHGIASFAVTSFSGYAVTVVPEPWTLGLLALGGLAMGLARRGRRDFSIVLCESR